MDEDKVSTCDNKDSLNRRSAAYSSAADVLVSVFKHEKVSRINCTISKVTSSECALEPHSKTVMASNKRPIIIPIFKLCQWGRYAVFSKKNLKKDSCHLPQ